MSMTVGSGEDVALVWRREDGVVISGGEKSNICC